MYGCACSFPCSSEHQRAECAVVLPRAEGIGQERRAVAVAHRLVKIHPACARAPARAEAAPHLVEHAESGRSAGRARPPQQVAVLAQQSRAEGVHRFDVRAVDAQQLPLQMRVERSSCSFSPRTLRSCAAVSAERGVGNDEKVVKVRFAALDVEKAARRAPSSCRCPPRRTPAGSARGSLPPPAARRSGCQPSRFSPFPDRPVNVLPKLLGSGRADVFDAVAAAAVFKVAGGREFAIGAGAVLLSLRAHGSASMLPLASSRTMRRSCSSTYRPSLPS